MTCTIRRELQFQQCSAKYGLCITGKCREYGIYSTGRYSGWEMSILKDLAPELEDVDTTMVNDDFSVNVEALADADVDFSTELGFRD